MSFVGPGAPDRRQLVARATQRWAEELIDLSGRNNLLHHRDLRAGTLDVSDGDLDAMNRLLSGRKVRLSMLLAPDATGDANRRMRTIARTAAVNFEEKGLRTAHLAVGMATWDEAPGAPVPRAPILLCPLSIVAAGPKGTDHELVLDGDWTINPTLLFKLRHDAGIEITDLEPTRDPDQDGFDVGDVQDVLADFSARVESAPNRLVGFSVDPRGVIGNFSYTRQPMVDDLERSLDQLVAHPLIAAMAGDAGAHTELQSRHGDIALAAPDTLTPANEFLVLDADSSQHHVINSALSGADLVVQGPPGTGKSQTIANLIASLVAQRRSVLFVAEKRAAIDAVTRRLIDIDLGGLVMDLHDGVSSRSRVATELADALATARSTPAVDRALEDQQLVEQRRRLAEHCNAMNALRPPWGVSVFDLQAELLGAPADHQFSSRLPAASLQALTLERVQQLSDLLKEWINLGGPTIADPVANPWAAAADRVRTAEQASSLITCVDHVVDELLPAAANQLRETCDAAGLAEPPTLDGWASMFGLLDEVARLGPELNPHALEVDLSGYVPALVPATRSGVRRWLSQCTDGEFRTAAKGARGWVADPELPLDQVRRLLIASGELRERWAAARVDQGDPRVPAGTEAARATLARLHAALASISAWTDRGDLATLPFHEIDRAVRLLSEGRNGLFRMPRLFDLTSQLAAAGLGQLLAEVAQRHFSAEEAAGAFQVSWLQAVLQWINANDPVVSSIEGTELSRREQDFRLADLGQISAGRDRVRRAWAEWVVTARDAFAEQEKTVLAQAARRRGHLPLRELFARAPDVMLALKPCWAMSPLVVSQLLPSVAGLFDVVIFDEASQVTPAEAIPALLRGKRVVVAGDSKQLPPTTFFATTNVIDDDDEVELDQHNVTADMESILDSLATLLPSPRGSRTLSWHYRSRDERLIAFSNAQASLYRGSMTTFPGVVADTLRFVLVDAADAAGPAEAARVVELIAEHARLRPAESLGVIALGIRHAEVIDDLLRVACTTDPVLEQFVTTPRPEPLFVKNLERVQGDERDAIILTIGYGKGADGRVRHHFGPINQVGGERRLNVAITRAKRRLTVVASFGAADLDPERLSGEGPQMLRRYLAYVQAEGHSTAGHQIADRSVPAPSAFELDILDRLRAAGIPVTAHHGVSGDRIDLALGHPDRPAEMVLAVESDGPSYASRPTARDRDRLRQDHLERLGWSFLRVWSTSWVRNPDQELGRIVTAWQIAVQAADRRVSPAAGVTDMAMTPPPPGPTIVLPSEPTVILTDPDHGPVVAARTLPRPAFSAGTPIGDYSRQQLIDIITWIESDTLLRTEDELLDVAIDELGYGRRGSRIVAALDDAIRAARASVPRRY